MTYTNTWPDRSSEDLTRFTQSIFFFSCEVEQIILLLFPQETVSFSLLATSMVWFSGIIFPLTVTEIRYCFKSVKNIGSLSASFWSLRRFSLKCTIGQVHSNCSLSVVKVQHLTIKLTVSLCSHHYGSKKHLELIKQNQYFFTVFSIPFAV